MTIFSKLAVIGLLGCLTGVSFAHVSLHGSKKIAEHQNKVADKEDLSRIEDDEQLMRFVKSGLLVPLEDTTFVKVDPRLKEQYRFTRPWTLRFLDELGMAFSTRFPGHSLQVNSAVRTIAEQKQLRKTNGNAAPTSGPTQSSHTTGQLSTSPRKT